ncbi:lipoprotein N-acyltransferase Lnb domain-containing protein [Oligoflexus tunisiensis]|uniref:lipoprotein N-acyltransferase Lnb domain-containing protein n=1 Tax=Oligoflexus tunisiensis TaxID=708132 RepID=UPI001C402D8F|nr:DUF4105 domain-containing protein [Oligoflexus tunisiensis]
MNLKCRAPDKYAFFQKLFPDFRSALDDRHCPSIDQGFLDDVEFLDPLSHEVINIGPINYDTVEGFELLYATPGVQDASEVAGHILLRMRLRNNPLAREMGLENPHDIVVAFLADTSEEQKSLEETARMRLDPYRCETQVDGNEAPRQDFHPITAAVQALKGLAGGYLTVFDRTTLFATIRRYTLDEDRTLLRYRLKLTELQKRSLLDRLFLARKSYKQEYYFFDRNCASVLVQIIGEGIGDAEVASFSAGVMPPNALIAMLSRRNLIEEVHPGFYSYKLEAQAAQEAIKKLYQVALRRPDLVWPTEAELFDAAAAVRSRAYFHLALIAKHDPSLSAAIKQILLLAPKAELHHLDKKTACLNYTSLPTATARMALKSELLASAEASVASSIWRAGRSRSHLSSLEHPDPSVGSPSVRLASFYYGLGVSDSSHTRPLMTAGGSLYAQNMGSMSRYSMQRATAVRFLAGEVTIDPSRQDQIESWRLSGISLRKFKERLQGVPPFLSRDGSYGFGLAALEAQGDPTAIDSTIFGGELLFNLASSEYHDHFLLLSTGSGIGTVWEADSERTLMQSRGRGGLSFSSGLEGLWTFDRRRHWQLRGELAYKRTFRDQQAIDISTGRIEIVARLGQGNDHEWRARFIFDSRWRRSQKVNQRGSYLLALDINDW